MDNKVTKKPKFGWIVKLNHEFPLKSFQRLPLNLYYIIRLIPLLLRYLTFYIWKFIKGQTVIMDFLKIVDAKQIKGVPIGGLGGGTIGRGWKGEFCNFHMKPGMYYFETVPANQFIVTIRSKDGSTLYQQVLSPNSKPTDNSLSAWKWEFPGELGEYTALYPRSWSEYNIPDQRIKLTCRQVSPIIPNNYKDSSIPSGVFVWDVENYGNVDLAVSITFTFQNGIGISDDSKGKCSSKFFDLNEEFIHVSGVSIEQNILGLPCTYNVAALKKEGNTVSRCPYFNPKGNGKSIWDELFENGKFNEIQKHYSPGNGKELGVAVCCQTEVNAGNMNTIEFSLVWDMPKITFQSSYTHKRFYTKYFGDSGKSGPVMSQYVLKHYKDWEIAIYDWQKDILDDENLPSWYKSAIFNEAYYISDGGTLWLLRHESEKFNEPGDPRPEFGRFGYLEGQEYRMYNTYDVHFYASFTLSALWPKLQTCIQYDFRDTIFQQDTSRVWYLYDGQITSRKGKCSVPHDLGDPAEEPFLKINAYNIHDISEWRDLNTKFVLQCFRSYKCSNDKDFVKNMWPQLNAVVEKAETWDCDGDDLIENSYNFPDQTYDTWEMKGSSAYCCSLWIAALYSMCIFSEVLEDEQNKNKYREKLNRAKIAFDKKLWNGQYYNFDSSNSDMSSTIMADQLCGLWYLHASGVIEEVFPKEKVKSVLKTIYEMNCQKFCNGEMGAVNGMKPNGEIEVRDIQSQEVWTGVNYGLSSLMIYEGMVKEGFKIAQGIYNTVYNEIGLGFQTPEALYENKNYRSVAYMRPLSIWSIQLAWKNHVKVKP